MDTGDEDIFFFCVFQQVDHVGHLVGNGNLSGLDRARTELLPSVMLTFYPGLDIRECRRRVGIEDR